MPQLAEEIWKTIWWSLIVATIITGFLRYFDNDRWWENRENENLKEYESNSLVYYSVKGIKLNSAVSAELFVKNIPQEKLIGNHGVFENILPGQIVSIKVISKDRMIRCPSFRLQDREIRHLTFTFDEEKNQLAYEKDCSRSRKLPPPALYRSGTESALAILNIENYKPLEEAAAKETPLKIVDAKNNKNNNVNLFSKYRSRLLNR